MEGAFRAYGGMQIVWEKEPEQALESAMSEGASYFRVDLPGGGMMVHLLKPQRPFNLQFGRCVDVRCSKGSDILADFGLFFGSAVGRLWRISLRCLIERTGRHVRSPKMKRWRTQTPSRRPLPNSNRQSNDVPIELATSK